jgi:hypothetical protein
VIIVDDLPVTPDRRLRRKSNAVGDVGSASPLNVALSVAGEERVVETEFGRAGSLEEQSPIFGAVEVLAAGREEVALTGAELVQGVGSVVRNRRQGALASAGGRGSMQALAPKAGARKSARLGALRREQ